MLRHTALTCLLGLVALAASSSANAAPPRLPRPAPVIYEHAWLSAPGGQLSKRADVDWTPTLVVRRDGAWSTAPGGPAGRLTPSELAEVRRAIGKARFVIDRGLYAICTGLPYRRERIKTPRGSLSWASPCAPHPHATVLTLERLVASLTVERARTVPIPPIEPEPPLEPIVPFEPIAPIAPVAPPTRTALVTLRTESLRSLDEGGGVVVYDDGAWSASGRSGTLSPGELAALRQRIAEVTVGPAPHPEACAARLDGFGTIEVAGRGAHRWSIPCGSLHPSLGALVSDVRRLTRAPSR